MNTCEQEQELFPLTQEERIELRFSKIENAILNLRKGTFSRITENTKEIMGILDELKEIKKISTKEDISIHESTKQCKVFYV